MGATSLESLMQKHEGEACDNGYPLMALHVEPDSRKWRWMVEEMRPPEEKWMVFVTKAHPMLVLAVDRRE